MKVGLRLIGALALVLAAGVVSPAAAQSELLKKAIDQFDQQEYVAAQETLRKVERDELSDAEKVVLDEYLAKAPDAIAGAQQAERDLAAADKAFEESRWQQADALYRSVIENTYAHADFQREAADQRQRIAARRGMADAARPQGPVEQAADETIQEAGDEPAKTATGEPAAQEQPAEHMEAPADEPVGTPPPPMQTGRLTVVEEQRIRDQLRWQRAVAQMEDLAVKARAAVAASDFDAAHMLASQAVQVIEAGRVYAEPATQYESAKAAAVALKQEVTDRYEEYQRRMATEQQLEIRGRIEQRRRLVDQQRREKIEQLFNSAALLRKEQRFNEAAQTLAEILAIDPGNAKAQHQLEIAEDYASLHFQRGTDEDRRRENRRTIVNTQEALIPWDYDVLYPKNWLELSAKRRNADVGVGQQDEDIELNRKLSDELPEFLFDDAPFEAVIEHLSDLQEVNLTVDWEDLDANAIERDKPVTVQLRQVAFATALEEVLSQVGGDVALAYSIGDGLIRIATKEKLDRDKLILVYDIRDLLVNVPRFTNAARLDPGQALNQLGQGGGAGGGGGGGGNSQLFETDEQDENDDEDGGAGMSAEIMDIIRQTVEPDSWRETGGGDGSIRELNGQLIVFNTSDAHRQVTDLLSQLRETRALQIAIETRFLTVSNNFLEEIGIDLDFVLNSGAAGFDRAFTAGGTPLIDAFTGAPVLQPRPFSLIGATPVVPGFGVPLTPAALLQPFGQAGLVPTGTGVSPHFGSVTPIPIQQGSIALTNPGSYNTGVPGSFAQAVGTNPALNIAGSFLDNLQVDFLIRATQANARSNIVQAPRLLMFNGQRANITVGRARQYVSSVVPSLAEGVVGFTPVIGQANSGASLDVEGTISADRKYVTVTVRTTQSKEPLLERFEVQRASGNSPGVFITLIDQEFATINTTISIPDGGTVLLGGMKQVGEIEVEAGVPILSKIPILKRAFTNTTTIKDTQTLLILLKAKIIIQKEAEEEAFPTFVTAGG